MKQTGGYFDSGDALEDRNAIESPGEYWVGRVVSGIGVMTQRERFGHIIAFDGVNAFGEVMIRVHWQEGHQATVRPSNLTLY